MITQGPYDHILHGPYMIAYGTYLITYNLSNMPQQWYNFLPFLRDPLSPTHTRAGRLPPFKAGSSLGSLAVRQTILLTQGRLALWTFRWTCWMHRAVEDVMQALRPWNMYDAHMVHIWLHNSYIYIYIYVFIPYGPYMIACGSYMITYNLFNKPHRCYNFLLFRRNCLSPCTSTRTWQRRAHEVHSVSFEKSPKGTKVQ